MLEAGQNAPEFSSVNQNDEPVKLSEYRSRNNVVLYFYPKDDTPGCTIEANDFTRFTNDFTAADTVVIGVSRDDCGSHLAFIDKFNLKVDLLADTSGEVCEAYGVWQEKEKNGVKNMGIVRSTFVIDKDGVLQAAMYAVDPNGHAEAILEMVKTM